MDASRARFMFDVLAPTGQLDRVRDFALSVRRSATDVGGLLVVGTPGYEPWHFTAHLTDEARYAGLPELEPMLVRWKVPQDAPAHLAVALKRLETTRRGETLLVITEERAPEQLLERIWDARKVGTTILTMDTGDAELSGLAHDALVVPETVTASAAPNTLDFDMTQHVLSVAAGEQRPSKARRMKDRLARFLDVVSGPSASSQSW